MSATRAGSAHGAATTTRAIVGTDAREQCPPRYPAVPAATGMPPTGHLYHHDARLRRAGYLDAGDAARSCRPRVTLAGHAWLAEQEWRG